MSRETFDTGEIVTLDTLFDEASDHGYYTDVVDGEVRYVTRDNNGRAIVGPKCRRKRGLFAWSKGPKRAATVQPFTRRHEPEHYDKTGNIHSAVREVAVDLAMWATMMSLAAIAVKCAVFVVML